MRNPIGYAGIFFGRKKVIELCQAFGMLCDRFRKESRTAALPVLYLAGRGQPGYVDSMNQALCSHEVRDRTTFFADINTPDEMRRFYQGLDLYIMLSTREGLSVSMLEAIACGCPSMILSPWGDDAIVDGETGLRLSSPQPEYVADQIYVAMQDRERLRAIGRRGATHVKTRFSQTSAALKLAEFYSHALESSSGV